MALNLYADLDQWERRYSYDTDLAAADRQELERIMEDASRDIDEVAGTHFYSEIAVLVFDGWGEDFLDVPDLLSVTTLEFDEDADGTYEDTLAAADFFLSSPGHARPYDATPKRRIMIDPNGDYGVFPPVERGVRITGEWGYSNDTEDSGAIVVGAQTASDTTLETSDGTKFSVGQTLVIGSEQLYVSAISGNNLTVTRGINGTTAASISGGETINRRVFPTGVAEATLIQAARRKKRIEGGEVTGAAAGLDMDAARRIGPYVRYDL